MLVEHGIDDVHEGFVGREQAVAAGEQIAFQPALACGLAQDLHRPAVGRQVIVGRQSFGYPDAVRHIQNGPEPI